MGHLEDDGTLPRPWDEASWGHIPIPFWNDEADAIGWVADLGDEYYGYIYDGLGLDPHALRPGETDDSDPDATFARDYLAADALKTATTINGILISSANHSHCLSWDGPDADGAYRCVESGPPDDWQDWLVTDANQVWILSGDRDPWSSFRFDVTGARDDVYLVIGADTNHAVYEYTLSDDEAAALMADIDAWLGR